MAAAVIDFQFRNSAIAEGARIVSIQSDRLVEIGDGSVVVAFSPISLAPDGEGVGGLWIELDRLAEIGDGSVEVAFSQISEAPVAKTE